MRAVSRDCAGNCCARATPTPPSRNAAWEPLASFQLLEEWRNVPITTKRGREEYMAERRSKRSQATFGSPMTIVGRRPVHTVTREPYISVHCLNLYHGLHDGKSHLLPTKGTGDGPGGLHIAPSQSEMKHQKKHTKHRRRVRNT